MAEAETADELAEDEGDKKKGRKLGLILLLLLGLGGGGAAGALYLAPVIGQRMADADDGGEAAAAAADHGQGGGGGGDHEGERAAAAGVLHLVDNLVVNPAGSGGTRFLLASVAFETSGTSLDDLITARDLEIRDGLIRTLGQKTVNQLTDYGQREALVEELADAIEAVLGEGTVLRIYLPQYVIQ